MIGSGGRMSKVFGVQLRSAADAAVLSFSGELDLAVRDRVVTAIAQALATAPTVVVDLTEVNFIDSSGLSALIRGRNAAHEAGRELFVRNASGPVATVLAVTGLDVAFAGPRPDDGSG